MIYKWMNIRLSDMRCIQPGVDFGQADPTLIHISTRHKMLVIKQKGTKYWSGIGDTSYAPAEVGVYRFDEFRHRGTYLRVDGLEELFTYHPTQKKAMEECRETITKIMDGLPKPKKGD